jgi:hypothetical protein
MAVSFWWRQKDRKLTDAKVLGLSLEERIFGAFCGFASSTWCRCGLLARSSLGFGGLVIETRTNQHAKQSTQVPAT